VSDSDQRSGDDPGGSPVSEGVVQVHEDYMAFNDAAALAAAWASWLNALAALRAVIPGSSPRSWASATRHHQPHLASAPHVDSALVHDAIGDELDRLETNDTARRGAREPSPMRHQPSDLSEETAGRECSRRNANGPASPGTVRFWRLFPWAISVLLLIGSHGGVLWIASYVFSPCPHFLVSWFSSILLGVVIEWFVVDVIIIVIRNRIQAAQRRIRSAKYLMGENVVVKGVIGGGLLSAGNAVARIAVRT